MAANRANIGWYIDNQIGGEDDRITGKVYEKMITLTTAEILLLNSAPKSLVAAPGIGKVVEFMSAVFLFNFDTAAFDNTSNLSIRTTTGHTAQSDVVAAAACLELGADGYGMFQVPSAETVIDVNDGLELYGSTVPGAGGSSTLKIKVNYRIHDFN